MLRCVRKFQVVNFIYFASSNGLEASQVLFSSCHESRRVVETREIYVENEVLTLKTHTCEDPNDNNNSVDKRQTDTLENICNTPCK